jgi:hypothetical protein
MLPQLHSAWSVVADDCTDDTAERARSMLNENGEVIECRLQSPGHARLRGTQAALRHFAGVVPNRLWLANTDADTLVPVDWLTRHLSFADRGSAAVAGIVKVEAVPGLDTTEMASLMSHYTLADDGTHTHVTDDRSLE